MLKINGNRKKNMTKKISIREKIAHDKGLPEDIVYISRAYSNTPRYHNDPECSHLKENPTLREISRKSIQSWGRPPCSNCVIGEIHYKNRNYSNQKCPYCDEKVSRLPTHLTSTDCGSL